MSEHIEGGCRCGAVRYRVKADKLPNVYACHCRDCQHASGGSEEASKPSGPPAPEVTAEARKTAQGWFSSYVRGDGAWLAGWAAATRSGGAAPGTAARRRTPPGPRP